MALVAHNIDALSKLAQVVGVPAAITFFILWQLIPKVDTAIANQAQIVSRLDVMTTQHSRLLSSCRST